jgi:hypothetical protein
METVMKNILLALLLLPALALAQQRISTLPQASTSTTGVEVFPVVQSGLTQKMSLGQIQAFLEGANNVWTGNNTWSGSATFSNLIVGPPPAGVTLQINMPNNSGGFMLSDGTSTLLDATDLTHNHYFGTTTGYDLTVFGGGFGNNILALSHSGGAYLNTGLWVGAPTGGYKGTGSINAQSIYVNNLPVSTNTTVFAYGVIDGVGSCSLSPNVENSNITSCTRNATGNYTVHLASVWTAPPACTVTAGGGSEGGTNAGSVQEGTTVLSGSYLLTILAFSPGITAQDNNFQITCMGR